jgi:SAM-dependent methyltransferase
MVETPAAREAHFETLYTRSEDPWHYRTSAYEDAKYRATLAALRQPEFRSALEAGCANGELSARIAPRCRRLVALDLSARAVVLARRRLIDFSHVDVRQATIPRDWPEGRFDLIVFSELLYYLDRAELAACAERTAAALTDQGELLLVNWQGSTNTPLSGREAAQIFAQGLLHLRALRVTCAIRDGYDLMHFDARGAERTSGPE